MIAMSLSSHVAQLLAVPGGLPANALRVTLASLDGYDDTRCPPERMQALTQLLAALARNHPPVMAEFLARIRLRNSGGTTDSYGVLVSGDALRDLRREVLRSIESVGLCLDEHTSFYPYVTLASVPSGAPHPARLGELPPHVTLTELSLWVGSEVVQFPFAAVHAVPPLSTQGSEKATELPLFMDYPSLVLVSGADAFAAQLDQYLPICDHDARQLATRVMVLRGLHEGLVEKTLEGITEAFKHLGNDAHDARALWHELTGITPGYSESWG